ncbi:DUF502 domain-containing protein [Agrobacterium vitis]|uniref:DUF502 domain-containing protein n=1 Tax=Agrobacterium vitis TaxID=373 RepID=A0A368NVE4_AGRVI|nr:DUF502 domain-containing protein [Agrobacterium vitis]KAA3516202.1 DUF502 domain-containing protein [Agrobacterium vitis]KAA3525826.1 DUF502 domain-containing protein [Agrobacterium vitis]MCF1478840.1 DUF502 domain-containing protein [Agrobacterium vitis]MUZ95536.1 DUF502 domain-containing protein [Agrobacterium vitis]MVA31307.1 DUF502 domain-containing protein [Agrobacterium vitis]
MSDKPERISFASRLRTNFLTGMIICAPLAITVWLTFTFIDWADSWVTPYIPQRYNPEYYFNIAIPGTGLVIAVVGITMIGFLGRNLVGRSIVNFGESILNRMPLVRTLYKSLKQIFETVLKEQSSSFKKVGLIEFPAPGTWAMVFVATEVTGEIAARLNEEGEEMIAVFMPPTPVPTAGFLMFVPRSRLKLLDMTPEEGAKLLISGGLVMPEWKPASGTIAMPPVVDVATGKAGL